MLTATPTKYGAGLTIWGDYYDLKAIHSTISYFFDKAATDYRVKEYTMALAYDIRHAYQGDRETKERGIDALDKAKYRGVSVLWPTYLTQIAILRQLAGYVPHTSFEQACLYLLENCARMALLEYNAEVGAACLAWLDTPPPFGKDYLVEYFNYSAKEYATEGKPGKARFRKLPIILRNFSFLSEPYRKFEIQIAEEAKTNNCSQHELGDWSDWPGFKW